MLKHGNVIISCQHPLTNNLKLKSSEILTYFREFIKGFCKLFVIHSKINYDLMILAHPYNPAIWLSKIITKKFLIIDPLISNYNSFVHEHHLYRFNSIKANILHLLEYKRLNFGNIILSDTKAHAKYFSKEFRIPKNKIKVLYLGADESIYHPIDVKTIKTDFILGFYGGFIPLQGVEYIIETADLLKNYKNIKFELVGGTEDNLYYQKVRNLAKKKFLSNIKFIPFVPEEMLPFYIQKSDIQLGIFGNTLKTKLVIPNKVYTSIAMKKTFITANTPAIKEIFKDHENCILCNIGDPKDLKKKILILYNNPTLRKELEIRGYELYRKNFTTEIIGKKLMEIINSIK